jgi:streptogramin lyase
MSTMTDVSDPEPPRRRFRLVVVVASVAAAVVGSVVLATQGSGSSVTTRGVTATLRVPDHPGSVAAGRDALWLGLSDLHKPVRDRPLLRLDLASGAIEQRIIVGGQARYLVHAGDRLLGSVEHVGGSGSGPSVIAAFDWRTGRVLVRRQFPSVVGPLAVSERDLWALQIGPAALLRLDPLTLLPKAAPLLLPQSEPRGLAVGGGYVWVTASDQLLRIDPATRAITRQHIEGSPVGVAFVTGNVWIVDRDRGVIDRLDPETLGSVAKQVRIGGEPAWLASGRRYVFVTDALEGTVTRIAVDSGEITGAPVRVAPPAKGGPGLAVASAADSVWVSSFASSSLTRVSATSTARAPRAVIASSRPKGAAGGRRLPPSGKVLARIPLGQGASPPLGGGAFAVGEGAIWAMSDVASTLMRIDPAKNAVVAKVRLDSTPESVAAGAGAVWLSYPFENVVRRIDPRTNKVTATIHIGPQPEGIAAVPGAVWVANAGGPSIARIDPTTNRVVATIRVGPKAACCAQHMSLVARSGSVWVAVPNANRIVQVDPATRSVVATVKLPYSPGAYLLADRTGIWSTGGFSADVVARVDTRTRKLTSRVYEPHPVGLGLFAGSVWVAALDSGNVDRIDPRTGKVAARLHVGGVPVRLGVGFGSVWVNDDNGVVLRIQPQG